MLSVDDGMWVIDVSLQGVLVGFSLIGVGVAEVSATIVSIVC